VAGTTLRRLLAALFSFVVSRDRSAIKLQHWFSDGSWLCQSVHQSVNQSFLFETKIHRTNEMFLKFLLLGKHMHTKTKYVHINTRMSKAYAAR